MHAGSNSPKTCPFAPFLVCFVSNSSMHCERDRRQFLWTSFLFDFGVVLGMKMIEVMYERREWWIWKGGVYSNAFLSAILRQFPHQVIIRIMSALGLSRVCKQTAPPALSNCLVHWQNGWNSRILENNTTECRPMKSLIHSFP